MTQSRLEAKERIRQFALEQYSQGAKIKNIREACSISATTLYRWINEAEEVKSRRPGQSGPDPHKKAAALKRWGKTKTKEQKKLETMQAGLSTLDILQRVNLSLGADNMGHYLYRGDDNKKVYLTDIEFDKLCKQPVQLLKSIAVRINAGVA